MLRRWLCSGATFVAASHSSRRWAPVALGSGVALGLAAYSASAESHGATAASSSSSAAAAAAAAAAGTSAPRRFNQPAAGFWNDVERDASLHKKIRHRVFVLSEHLGERFSEPVARRLQHLQHETLPSIEMPDMDPANYIDHTLVKPDASAADIRKLCSEAIEHHFAAVCVNPCRAGLALGHLQQLHRPGNPRVKVAAVVGFPLGANSTNTKVVETKELVHMGVDEIDVVINVGMLKESKYISVFQDISAVIITAKQHSPYVLVKVILETGALNSEQIIDGALIAAAAGADFVKTSTGFGYQGAKPEDVRLMKMVVGNALQIKASGGIRTWDSATTMIENGATRIGTSSGVDIVLGDEVDSTRKISKISPSVPPQPY